jgi:hypothetical protein
VVAALKGLLKIVGGSFVLFMLLAIAQEWAFFSSAWFGDGETAAPSLEETDRRAAADAVHGLLTVMRHYYASGGDPRFIERAPAAPGLLEEIRADVEYLARNHRYQEMDLERMDVLSIDPLRADTVELRTREQWTVRFVNAVGGSPIGSPASQTVHAKYLVVRGVRGWSVEGWEIVEPAAS